MSLRIGLETWFSIMSYEGLGFPYQPLLSTILSSRNVPLETREPVSNIRSVSLESGGSPNEVSAGSSKQISTAPMVTCPKLPSHGCLDS